HDPALPGHLVQVGRAQSIIDAILRALPRAHEAILVGHSVLLCVEQVCESIPARTRKSKRSFTAARAASALTQTLLTLQSSQRCFPKEKPRCPMCTSLSTRWSSTS